MKNPTTKETVVTIDAYKTFEYDSTIKSVQQHKAVPGPGHFDSSIARPISQVTTHNRHNGQEESVASDDRKSICRLTR